MVKVKSENNTSRYNLLFDVTIIFGSNICFIPLTRSWELKDTQNSLNKPLAAVLSEGRFLVGSFAEASWVDPKWTMDCEQLLHRCEWDMGARSWCRVEALISLWHMRKHSRKKNGIIEGLKRSEGW